MRTKAVVWGVVGAVSFAAACGEPRETTGHVIWEVTTGLADRDTAGRGPSVVVAAPESTIVALGRDTLVIRRAEFVAKEVMLQPQRTQECEPEHGEFCGEVQTGAALIDLPLDGAAREIRRAQVAPDVYGVFQVRIHKVTVAEDSAFSAANPGLVGRSIQVEGTYSRAGKRQDFTWVSDFNEIEEVALPATLPLAVGDTVAVTLRIDLASWFVNQAETGFIAPNTIAPGSPEAIRVRDNIRMSLRATGRSSP